ncbi:MAG: hypothetical protein ACHQJ6_00740 [Candidatus Berkiellales bacterium]
MNIQSNIKEILTLMCCCFVGTLYADSIDPAVCNGLSGAQFGLCNAYCVAVNCADPSDIKASPQACKSLLKNWNKQVPLGTPFPCTAKPQIKVAKVIKQNLDGYITNGDNVLTTVTITNTGSVPLVNLQLTDNPTANFTCNPSLTDPLLQNQTITCTSSTTASCTSDTTASDSVTVTGASQYNQLLTTSATINAAYSCNPTGCPYAVTSLIDQEIIAMTTFSAVNSFCTINPTVGLLQIYLQASSGNYMNVAVDNLTSSSSGNTPCGNGVPGCLHINNYPINVNGSPNNTDTTLTTGSQGVAGVCQTYLGSLSSSELGLTCSP